MRGGAADDERQATTVSTAAGADAVDAAMPAVGERIGSYVLLTELGRGGMGRVYLAEDERLRRKVAIKFVAVHGAAARRRFLDEAQVTARCTHPNIVVIHDIAEHDGVPFMVLEYVRGPSLAALLRDVPLPPDQAVSIMTQVARALAHAHANGVIHRDLKPANILLGADGTAKVVDFGIARSLDQLEPERHAAGTLPYMAPEQLAGGPIDPRADLFAFGVTLFQLLQGRRPLHALADDELVDHLRELDRPLPSLAALRPDLPPALTALADRCLAKPVDARIGSAADVLTTLEGLSSEPAVTPKPPSSRGRRLAAAVAAAAVLAAVAVFAVARHERRARPAEAHAAVIARLDELFAELDRLHAAGALAEEQRLFQEFLEAERDPAVIAQAWLRRADRELARDELEPARISYSAAYARGAAALLQHQALVGLATVYLHGWEWDRLVAAIAVDATLGVAPDDQAGFLRDRSLLAVRAPDTGLAPSPPTAAVAAALLHGTPSPTAAWQVVAVDVDGDGRDEVLALEDGALVLRGGNPLVERGRRDVPGIERIHCAGAGAAGAYAVTAKAAHFEIVELTADSPPVPIDALRTRVPTQCAWHDLDGDGAVELYMLGARALHRIVRDRDGAWRARRHELGSEAWDLVGGDLDGDGRQELIVSVGEWRAYDVRVYRLAPDGALALRDRIRLGVVTDLVALGRGAGGRGTIAAWKDDVWASARHLPAGHPFGAPAGIYLLELAGDKLAVRRRFDLPHAARIHGSNNELLAAELDGDGRVDLLVTVCDQERLFTAKSDHERRCNLVVMLAQPDGEVEVRVLGGFDAVARVQADDDAADEVVAYIDAGDTPWVLGAGSRAVPARAFPTVTSAPPPRSVAGQRAVAAAWQRAEDLAAIGLVEAAADALRRIGGFGASPAAQRDALRRAAALLRGHGQSAADVLEALSRLEAPRSRGQIDARLDALDEYLASAQLAPARRVAELLRADEAALSAADRGRLTGIEAELGGERIALFDGALHPTWRVDPTLAHVPPGSRGLVIETLTPDRAAEVPLVRGPGALGLVIDAQVTRTEWAGQVTFRLGPRDRAEPGAILASVWGRGGGGINRRQITCFATPLQRWDRSRPAPRADDPLALRIEVTIVPSRRVARCTITLDGEAASSQFAIAPGDATDWALTVEGGSSSAMTAAAARISTIEVTGFTPGAVAADPRARAAFALAEHRAGDALGALAALTGADRTAWATRALEVLALDELGDRPRAIALIRDAVPPTPELARLLRVREGQLAPVIRAALGRRVAPALLEAWSRTIEHDLHEPRVLTATLRDLDDLPAPTAATRDSTLALLWYRGQALFLAGRPDEGRRTILAALALARPDLPDPLRQMVEMGAHRLAADAVARGDHDAAERWAAQAIDVAPYPELAADQLLLDPVTRPLAAAPGGARITTLGRDVQLGPW